MNIFGEYEKRSEEPKFLPGDIVVVDEFYTEFGFKNLIGVVISSEIIKDEGDESGSWPPYESWDYLVLMDVGVFNFEERDLARLEEDAK